MKPEPTPLPGPERRLTTVDWLALTHLTTAPDQDVRVFEALAATLVRQARLARQDLGATLRGVARIPFRGVAAIDDVGRKMELCRRVARRAIHGSLLDPAPGATVFHRIGESPPWSHNLLPVAFIGSFLFYDLAGPERTRDVDTGRAPTPEDRLPC